MFQQTIELSDKINDFKVVFIGDMHIGSAGFRPDVLDSALREIKGKNTRWLCLGDAVEGREPGHRFYDDDACEMNVGEQYEYFFKKIRPYRDKCLGIHPGNHEESLNNKTTINPIKAYCLDNKIAYLGGVALTTLKKSNKSFKMCTTHGAGGGIKIGSSINKISDYLLNFDADAIISGHFHKLSHSINMRGFNDELGHYRWKPTHVILNGSCLQSYTDGRTVYSERKLMPPTALGYSYITLDSDLRPIVRLVPIQ